LVISFLCLVVVKINIGSSKAQRNSLKKQEMSDAAQGPAIGGQSTTEGTATNPPATNATLTSQGTELTRAKPPAYGPETLSAVTEELKKTPNAQFTATWSHAKRCFRDDRTYTSDGTVFEVCDNVLWVAYAEVNTDSGDHVTIHPFPNPDAEYYNVVIHTPRVQTARTVLKRGRETLDAEGAGETPRAKSQAAAGTQPQQSMQAPEGTKLGHQFVDSMSNQDFAHMLMDAKSQRPSRMVPGASGLRIPAAISDTYHCLYPMLWWNRRAKNEDANELFEEWCAAFQALEYHIAGGNLSTTERDKLSRLAQVQALSITSSRTPTTRDDWQLAYVAIIQWLEIAIAVRHGTDSATTVIDAINVALQEPGLLDIEKLINAVEAKSAKTKVSERTTPAPTSAECRQDQSFNNGLKRITKAIAAATQPRYFRGRGRGRGRGGRGGGTNTA
jgi:hypothetical protein